MPKTTANEILQEIPIQLNKEFLGEFRRNRRRIDRDKAVKRIPKKYNVKKFNVKGVHIKYIGVNFVAANIR